jgi:hypothetical protein
MSFTSQLHQNIFIFAANRHNASLILHRSQYIQIHSHWLFVYSYDNAQHQFNFGFYVEKKIKLKLHTAFNHRIVATYYMGRLELVHLGISFSILAA